MHGPSFPGGQIWQQCLEDIQNACFDTCHDMCHANWHHDHDDVAVSRSEHRISVLDNSTTHAHTHGHHFLAAHRRHASQVAHVVACACSTLSDRMRYDMHDPTSWCLPLLHLAFWHCVHGVSPCSKGQRGESHFASPVAYSRGASFHMLAFAILT